MAKITQNSMKARIRQLHKTEAEWNKLSDFIPLVGELIIYDPDDQHEYARLKIGDGISQPDGTVSGTKLKDLPFSIETAINECLAKIRYDEIIDCGNISDYLK